ncbi:MAG: hypothetical protein HXS46_03170 [Theionarchaea archaeon]|nr:MAG: hypothetical protein AYK18_09345 [Theionarchaea archaeon DG-70]MBU7009667.1 hypothetical protein [Theionarchaea archaeon]
MKQYDFDPDVQRILGAVYGDIPSINWRQWLAISSVEEYESTALKLSGLSTMENLFERMKNEKTDPKSFSVNVESFLGSHEESPVIMCHTSGTSGGDIADVKWFHMSRTLVTQLWAPGMQAIFESSGLNARSSAVIFVPSRAHTDGLSVEKGKTTVRLYSAEFSQRLVLSLMKPRSYVLYEYKDAKSVQVLAKILSMDGIAVVSAPFVTVLGWANLNQLRKGLEKSLDAGEYKDTPEVDELKKKIRTKGLDAAAIKIQKALSDKLLEATVIFSTTGMTDKEWDTIRDFLQWKKGEEQFTNLYVGSEVGPFAASIGSDSQSMQVFPLTVPVIEHRGDRDLISRTKNKVGKLFVSRLHGDNPVINIDTGDVITIESQEGLPVIQGDVLRAGFPLKTEIFFSPEISTYEKKKVLVGTYFDLEGIEIEIRNPRKLLACLAEQCHLDKKSSVVLKKEGDHWIMVIPSPDESCSPIDDILNTCPGGKSLGHAIKEEELHTKMVDENPVNFLIPRSELLEKVRKGNLPKGVLKRWPLYVVMPSERFTNSF